MLNILFGECPEAIYNTSMYFDNQYLDCWMEDPFAAEVIAGIEKGKILSPQAIDTINQESKNVGTKKEGERAKPPNPAFHMPDFFNFRFERNHAKLQLRVYEFSFFVILPSKAHFIVIVQFFNVLSVNAAYMKIYYGESISAQVLY